MPGPGGAHRQPGPLPRRGARACRARLSWGGSENVLVVLNGLKLNENVTGGAAAVNLDIPVDNVKKIEVVRGPGSVLHGPGAFLAVIHIVTESVDTFRRDEITLRGRLLQELPLQLPLRHDLEGREPGRLHGVLVHRRGRAAHPGGHPDVTDRALRPLVVPPASRAPGRTVDDRKSVDANLALAWQRIHVNLRHKEENARRLRGPPGHPGEPQPAEHASRPPWTRAIARRCPGWAT